MLLFIFYFRLGGLRESEKAKLRNTEQSYWRRKGRRPSVYWQRQSAWHFCLQVRVRQTWEHRCQLVLLYSGFMLGDAFGLRGLIRVWTRAAWHSRDELLSGGTGRYRSVANTTVLFYPNLSSCHKFGSNVIPMRMFACLCRPGGSEERMRGVGRESAVL